MSAAAKQDLEKIAGQQDHADPLEVIAFRELASDRLIQHLVVLWHHRRILFRLACVGLLVGTSLAFLLPKQFESTTRLMPPDDQSNTGMAFITALGGRMNGGLAPLAGDLLGVKGSGALFLEILRSRTVQDGLVNKFDLRKVYREREWERTRRVLAGNTSLAEDRKSGVITIAVSDRDPERAAALAREYVVELNTVVSQLSTSSAHRERVFLEERLKQVKHELETAEQDFSQYASKNATIDIKEQGKAMVDAAAILQGQLIATESELEGMRQIYTDNNVRTRALKARATELHNQLEKLGGEKKPIGSELSEEPNGSLYPTIRKLPLLGVLYADLYRRIKVQEVVFETLTQEYELAKVAEAKEIPSVKVFDPANVPEEKSFPPRLRIMFVCTALALAGASMWVLSKTRWSQVDPRSPGKVFVQDVCQSIGAYMPWATPNGSRLQAATHKVWVKIVQRADSAQGAA